MENVKMSIIERVLEILAAGRMQGRTARTIVSTTISLDIAPRTATVGAVRRSSKYGYGIVATVFRERGEDGYVHCCTVRAPSGRTERIAIANALIAVWAAETEHVHSVECDDDRNIDLHTLDRISQRETLAAAHAAVAAQIERNAAC